MAEVEHHWHNPTLGQVTKAVYQFLSDHGYGAESITKVVDAKVKDAVASKIDSLINSKRFDDLIVAAVASYVKNAKEVFDRNGGYGLVNHIRDLICKQLQETILSEYQVTVTKKT